jgi:hypothetical protein
MMDKSNHKKKSPRIDVERLNSKADSFDKKMNKVRRDFIQKSSNSKKSASELILTS